MTGGLVVLPDCIHNCEQKTIPTFSLTSKYRKFSMKSGWFWIHDRNQPNTTQQMYSTCLSSHVLKWKTLPFFYNVNKKISLITTKKLQPMIYSSWFWSSLQIHLYKADRNWQLVPCHQLIVFNLRRYITFLIEK